jgi:hypothetical protein
VSAAGERAIALESDAARRFALEAAHALASARELRATLHEPGQRDRYRALLRLAIEGAVEALEQASERDSETVTSARSTLVKAHAANAEDALHGAGQLSQSAQRAPTLDACNDGWERVRTISAVAETSASLAASIATELERDVPASKTARAARAAARQAESAARASRRIVEGRNDAYTFHTDGGFSFGEGWYLAAASVLAGVSIQIEPGKDGTESAERFLRDAGLAERLKPYRSRPRAMKQTTELVARAFSEDAAEAQRRLRAAFLGDAPVSGTVSAWLDQKLAQEPRELRAAKKVLLWIRYGVHHPGRNTSHAELLELTACVERAGLVPVWTGDAPADGRLPDGVIDMILFWKDPIFRSADRRRAQLDFFEHLKARHGLVGQLGVTTAGMDGPALLGLSTIYLTDAPNARMGEWVGRVPGYVEVVRSDGYLDRIERMLGEWAATGSEPSPNETAQGER